MKTTLKCADLFTASFADGDLMTGTLEQIYAAQNGRNVTIRPVVWLYQSKSGAYIIDYIMEGFGSTLGVFDTLSDAETARNVLDAQPAADVARMLHAETVKCFSCPMHLDALGNDGKRYQAEYSPETRTIYYTIPAKVDVLGYIPVEGVQAMIYAEWIDSDGNFCSYIFTTWAEYHRAMFCPDIEIITVRRWSYK